MSEENEDNAVIFGDLLPSISKISRAISNVILDQRYLLNLLKQKEAGKPLGLRNEELSSYLKTIRGDLEIQSAVDELLFDHLLLLRDPLRSWGKKGTNLMMEHIPSLAVEACRFKIISNQLHIFLSYRPFQADDLSAYAGQWHCSGTIVRNSDKVIDQSTNKQGLEKSLMRLAKETGMDIQEYLEVGHYNNYCEQRGWVESKIMLILQVASDPKIDGRNKWWPIGEALQNQKVVDVHREKIIPLAARAFLKLQGITRKLDEVIKDGIKPNELLGFNILRVSFLDYLREFE
ncbi:MAG TPA: hypothetical protein PKM84_02475 [Candidatus Pacearchaeota archaeon]|nr:hypothetical protein [Candidatus Pacearchaeota archaeon]